MSCICDCILRRHHYEHLGTGSTGSIPNSETTVTCRPSESTNLVKDSTTSLRITIEESVQDQERTEPLPSPTEESNFSRDTSILGSKGSVRKENGCALHIRNPEGAIRNVEVEFNVYYPDAGTALIPEGSELVSSVCRIDSKGIELEKRDSLAIEHCMYIRNGKDRDSVGVVKHKERRKGDSSGSHHFEYVESGKFEVKNHCVVVRLKKQVKPMHYAVVCKKKGRKALRYCGMLYRQKSEAKRGLPTTKFTFMVVKDLDIYVKAVEHHCAARKLERTYEPMPVTFKDGQEMKLTLGVEEGGLSYDDGWHIYPSAYPAEILESDARRHRPTDDHIPSLELILDRKHGASMSLDAVRFVGSVEVHGTIKPKSLTLQHEPERSYSRETPGANKPKMSELIMCVGQNEKHNIPAEVGTDYQDFGILLLTDDNGTTIKNIEYEYKNCAAINREILRQWLEGKGKKPLTWATLIKVLEDIGKHTLAKDIECGLKEREQVHF